MKIKNIFLLFLCLPFSGGHDFRNTDWGMTMEQVKQAETLKLESQIGSELRYSKSINGISCSLVYYFLQGKLAKAVYTSKENYINYQDFISDYDTFKELLIKKYGTPKSDKLNWINPKLKDKPDQYGSAVATGQLQYEAEWKNERTDISILLKGANRKCRMTVTYKALNTKWNTQGKNQNDALDDL